MLTYRRKAEELYGGARVGSEDNVGIGEIFIFLRSQWLWHQRKYLAIRCAEEGKKKGVHDEQMR